jgi:sec-independent protein translocase protein TatA
MFGLGPWELLLVFLAILLLFGAKRIPEIAQGMGKGIREFKKAMKDTGDEIKSSADETKKPADAAPAPPKPDEHK